MIIKFLKNHCNIFYKTNFGNHIGKVKWIYMLLHTFGKEVSKCADTFVKITIINMKSIYAS